MAHVRGCAFPDRGILYLCLSWKVRELFLKPHEPLGLGVSETGCPLT